MRLAKEVATYTSACEHILSTIAMGRPLTKEEATIIDYYCKELQAKVAPILNRPD